MDEAEPMLDDVAIAPPTPTDGQMSDMLIDALVLAGVRERTAHEYASAVMELEKTSPTFIEVYGRGNVVAAANGPRNSLNVKGLDAIDLTTLKKSGDHWDFSFKRERDEARQMVADLKPTWVIGSPPCTAFSSWQHVNYATMSPEDVQRKKLAGLVHLKFVAQLYKDQVK